MRARALLFFLAIAALVVLPAGESFAATSYERGAWNVTGATWYGPGLFGNGTACGQRLERTTLGVAHRSLPCGHLVELEWQGHTLVVPVIDRGPFGTSAEWDITQATCENLTGRSGVNRCMTADIAWRL